MKVFCAFVLIFAFIHVFFSKKLVDALAPNRGRMKMWILVLVELFLTGVATYLIFG